MNVETAQRVIKSHKENILVYNKRRTLSQSRIKGNEYASQGT